MVVEAAADTGVAAGAAVIVAGAEEAVAVVDTAAAVVGAEAVAIAEAEEAAVIAAAASARHRGGTFQIWRGTTHPRAAPYFFGNAIKDCLCHVRVGAT